MHFAVALMRQLKRHYACSQQNEGIAHAFRRDGDCKRSVGAASFCWCCCKRENASACKMLARNNLPKMHELKRSLTCHIRVCINVRERLCICACVFVYIFLYKCVYFKNQQFFTYTPMVWCRFWWLNALAKTKNPTLTKHKRYPNRHCMCVWSFTACSICGIGILLHARITLSSFKCMQILMETTTRIYSQYRCRVNSEV